MKLIISESMLNTAGVRQIADHFANAGSLIWLTKQDGNSLVGPSISSLKDIEESDYPIFLVAPSDECAVSSDRTKFLIRVLLREELNDRKEFPSITIDSYEQLSDLLTLPRYAGLTRLVSHRGWTATDFRAAILNRYSESLNRLRNTKQAAIFGAQRLGELVLDSLTVQGVSVSSFIDNSEKKHGTSLRGLPIMALADLRDKGTPIVIATTRFSKSIAEQLEKNGYPYVLPYSVMTLLDSTLYPDEIPYVGIQEDLADNALRYVELFLALADEKSRRVLDGLLTYRMDYDARYADGVADEYARQYFDKDLIKFDGKDVFVDLGGFDGDTAEKFIQYADGAFKKIYLFEPDSKLMDLAKQRLGAVRSSVEFVPAGAYSKDGDLRFTSTGRTNGSITDDGEIVIPVLKVDTAVKDSPTLLKMDIEGAESAALMGAANTLKAVKPRLAIAAYHFGHDLWQLVNLVRELNPAYKFYLRHYSETGLESVIYAL